jgi:hypothetical protein
MDPHWVSLRRFADSLLDAVSLAVSGVANGAAFLLGECSGHRDRTLGIVGICRARVAKRRHFARHNGGDLPTNYQRTGALLYCRASLHREQTLQHCVRPRPADLLLGRTSLARGA